VVVRDGAGRRVFTIEGGFADVTPDSFTLLAEHATEAVISE
jgi:F-type H+-transporting ATPase subunit epsilon